MKRVIITESQYKKLFGLRNKNKHGYSDVLPLMEYCISLGIWNYLEEALNFSYDANTVCNIINGEFSLDKNYIHYLNGGYKTYSGTSRIMPMNGSSVILVLVPKTSTYFEDISDRMLKLGWLFARNAKISKKLAKNFWCLQFEKKYDNDYTEFVKNNRFVYHVCSIDNYNNTIKQDGLIPSHNQWNEFNKLSKTEKNLIWQPQNDYKNISRVYCFLKYPTKENLRSFKAKGYRSVLVLKIDATMLQNTKFYADPRNNASVYTDGNIPPNAIVAKQIVYLNTV